MSVRTPSTTVRLAAGLALLSAALVMVGSLFGLLPDREKLLLESRLKLAELLASAITLEVSRGDSEAIPVLIALFRERNPEVGSVRLRRDEGRSTLRESPGGSGVDTERKDSSERFVVPIRDGTGPWGALEIEFEDEGALEALFRRDSPATIALFLAMTGFLGFWLFLRHTLAELDPDAVVPDRVNAVLDTLGEGIVMLDRQGRVVLANEAFREKTARASSEIVGRDLSRLPWELEGEETLPWDASLAGEQGRRGCQVRYRGVGDATLCFAVNAASIRDPAGAVRGVVVTFDDVTELQRKNANLERALERLGTSQREIRRQNEELRLLATSDPLTGSLNRRSLFEGLHALLDDSRERERPIGCIMVDLDHFKEINDGFGHAVGDKVIKLLARVLRDVAPAQALVGRYGGEEFCIVIPGFDEVRSVVLAEQVRRRVLERSSVVEELGSRRVSASLGVSCDVGRTLNADSLVDLADKALYAAKASGRDRVVPYSSLSEAAEPGAASSAAATRVGDFPGADAEPREPSREPELDARTSGASSGDDAEEDDAAGGGVAGPVPPILTERLSRTIRRSRRLGTSFAALIVEFPTVALVRNTAGEGAADKLLGTASRALRDALEANEAMSRSGDPEGRHVLSRGDGGQFVVLLCDIGDREAIPLFVQRLFGALEAPVEIEGREVLLDARVGASVYPTDGDDGPTLLTAAVSALYEALTSKERNTCAYFSDELTARAERFLLLQSQLHTALDKGELSLMYQPLVDMRTGGIGSFEALLRWRHPELGMVSPELFIPIAEHTGLIDEIGDWVVRTACRQLRAWQDRGLGGLSVAVNLAAPQLRRADLVTRIAAIIERAGIDPRTLTLELTESALIENFDVAVSVVEGLSDIGARVALDDFGTGYSSLSYLKSFPIDIVKIDRSFFTDFPDEEHSMAIVSAIISLVHSLGLKVVAEGVETGAQLAFLQSLNVDVVQGYHFSAPLTHVDASALLANPEAIRRKFRAAGQAVPSGMASRPAVIEGVLSEAPRRAA